MEELENLFESTEKGSRLPMLNERLSVLQETGSILLKVNLFKKYIEKEDFLFKGIWRTFFSLY